MTSITDIAKAIHAGTVRRSSPVGWHPIPEWDALPPASQAEFHHMASDAARALALLPATERYDTSRQADRPPLVLSANAYEASRDLNAHMDLLTLRHRLTGGQQLEALLLTHALFMRVNAKPGMAEIAAGREATANRH